MSISNLLSSNTFDLKCKTLTAETVTAENGIPSISVDVSFQTTAANIDNVPVVTGNDTTPNNWIHADDSLVTSGNTFNWPLNTINTQILDLSMSFVNVNNSSTRGVGIALMFQRENDTWDVDNVPYVWNVINFSEGVQVRLVHKLLAGHGYKRARLLVNAEGNGSDIRYGFGSVIRGCFCSLTTTSYT